ncbi:FMN-binding protein [Ampullimonas aquatilis]|uniref:FMN-binding protein n=1 Tax=Ampullimonas aquatilis TaxID=1341549 RepID=UPI003C7620CF
MKKRYSNLTALAVLATASTSAWATQYLTAEEAQRVLFPEATQFQDNNLQLSAEQMKQIEQLAALPARSQSWRVFSAYKDTTLLGYIVIDDVIGKFELISYAVGIAPDASIRQIEILAYRESHGFEIRNAAWRKQFVGKHVQDGLVVGNGIANISGATLSCTHITDGVRRIAALAQIMLKQK